jgi:hypothetical protein
MLKITRNPKSGFSLLVLFSLVVFFSSCDSMEEDAFTGGPTVTVEGNKVYVMPDGTAYIDLFSRIKTNGTVSLDIASQPRRGTLTEVAAGFLKYSPDNDFTFGRDAFRFSILGDKNQLLKLDSIEIILKDSLDLPCGIYPKDDWVFSAGTPLEVDVLWNDFICGDSMDVKIEIYKPGNAFPPLHGVATITSTNRIRYSPSSSNNLPDTVVYKVSMKSDPDVFGFGTLYIDPAHNCDPSIGELEAVYDPKDSTSYPLSDSIYIHLIDNVVRCGTVYSDLTVTNPPDKGPIRLDSLGVYYYFNLKDSTDFVLDSMNYKLCKGAACVDGMVKIKINY